MSSQIAVIGCGNSLRSDDGAGPAVIRLLTDALAGREPPGLRLLDAGTDGMGVMFAARGCARLILVDACMSGSEPGAVFEAPGAELEGPPRDSFNLHDFRWDHALYAGRRIYGDGFPADVTVFLIEAGSLAFGAGLTPPVAAAAQKVAARIGEMIGLRSSTPAGSEAVELKDGRLYLSRAAYENYVPASNTVILLRDGKDLLVLPMAEAGAGGYLIKIRNAAGDRVIGGADFFRDEGLGDGSWRGRHGWCERLAGLRLYDVFLM